MEWRGYIDSASLIVAESDERERYQEAVRLMGMAEADTEFSGLLSKCADVMERQADYSVDGFRRFVRSDSSCLETDFGKLFGMNFDAVLEFERDDEERTKDRERKASFYKNSVLDEWFANPDYWRDYQDKETWMYSPNGIYNLWKKYRGTLFYEVCRKVRVRVSDIGKLLEVGRAVCAYTALRNERNLLAAKMPLPVKKQLSEPANASPDDQPQQEEKPVDEVKPQQEEAKPVLIDDTGILMKVYNEFNGEIWANVGAAEFVAMMQTGDLTKLKILPKQRTKLRYILGGIRLTTDKEKSNRWCENVMKSTGVNPKKATPTVTEDVKSNSLEMEKFSQILSKIFPQKAR